jgi:hypothetical protein
MPKYVFEVSLTLAADEDLTVAECNLISARLAERLAVLAGGFGKTGGRVSAEPPFEHVTADWLPPNEQGQITTGPSRRIDFDRPKPNND